MKKTAKSATAARFSPRACLAAIGAKLRVLAPVREKLRIHQQTVKHAPLEKIEDALIAILAGAHGLAEINTRLRSDPALQRAFGRRACADQSVVQATLNACSSTNVDQLMEALDAIFRRQSLALRHDFKAGLLVLDADITGMPCGKKAEGSAKGLCFAKMDQALNPNCILKCSTNVLCLRSGVGAVILT